MSEPRLLFNAKSIVFTNSIRYQAHWCVSFQGMTAVTDPTQVFTSNMPGHKRARYDGAPYSSAASKRTNAGFKNEGSTSTTLGSDTTTRADLTNGINWANDTQLCRAQLQVQTSNYLLTVKIFDPSINITEYARALTQQAQTNEQLLAQTSLQPMPRASCLAQTTTTDPENPPATKILVDIPEPDTRFIPTSPSEISKPLGPNRGPTTDPLPEDESQPLRQFIPDYTA